MAKICGEVNALEGPVGGGVHITKWITTNWGGETSTSSTWSKSRMVFPTVQIGDHPPLRNAFVAGDPLGHEIGENIKPGDRVCVFTFGHLLRKQVIIGVKKENGEVYRMPGRGLFSGLLWYLVFSPIIVAIPAGIVGMLVGMVGGKKGTSMGLLFGVLYAVGISWLSAYRFFKAYNEMSAST
jgi:hypothetical protein